MSKLLARLSALSASLLLTACGPSLASLHDRALVGQVQSDAPLHARHAVTIKAPVDAVWARLADLPAWPAWHPVIRSVEAPATLTPGSRFRWNNGGTTIASTLAIVRPGQELAWTGSVSTAKAVHIWRLSEAGPGQTRVEVDETMDGFLLTWFYSQNQLDKDVGAWLTDLKLATETPAGLR
jgi:uncharacterized membrane protein